MIEKINSLPKINTWELTELPKEKRLLVVSE